MGMGQADVEAYVEALRSLDPKAFRGYFQGLVQRGKRGAGDYAIGMVG